jgi:arylsulfatase A
MMGITNTCLTRSARSILSGDEQAKSIHEAFYYYRDDHLQTVRSEKWKLHVFRPETGTAKIQYGLEDEVGEYTDVAGRYPEVVRRLDALAEKAREDRGDAATDRAGNNARSIGKLYICLKFMTI